MAKSLCLCHNMHWKKNNTVQPENKHFKTSTKLNRFVMRLVFWPLSVLCVRSHIKNKALIYGFQSDSERTMNLPWNSFQRRLKYSTEMNAAANTFCSFWHMARYIIHGHNCELLSIIDVILKNLRYLERKVNVLSLLATFLPTSG